MAAPNFLHGSPWLPSWWPSALPRLPPWRPPTSPKAAFGPWKLHHLLSLLPRRPRSLSSASSRPLPFSTRPPRFIGSSSSATTHPPVPIRLPRLAVLCPTNSPDRVVPASSPVIPSSTPDDTNPSFGSTLSSPCCRLQLQIFVPFLVLSGSFRPGSPHMSGPSSKLSFPSLCFEFHDASPLKEVTRCSYVSTLPQIDDM